LRHLGVAATWFVAACAASLAAITLARGDLPTVTVTSPLPILDLAFGVGVLAVPFLFLLALLALAVGIWSLERGTGRDAALVGVFAGTMLLVLCAQSVAAFWIAWEAMSLVSAILVATHFERRIVRRATLTYLAVAQAGALCIIAALVLLALHAGSSSFAAIAANARNLPSGVRDAAFALALAGFGSKAGFVPLHFWLPRAHPVAPANASAMLSGAMLKVAVYGLAFVVLQLAGPPQLLWGIVVAGIGAASALIGVLYAIVDHDLKRLLAYHSVENVGIIAMGLGVAFMMIPLGKPAIAALGLVGALFHTINHGVFKGLLFLGAGTVSDREGTVDLERLGGLWGSLVWTAPFFLIGCAAISALPPFNGFISEWTTFQALVAGLPASPPGVQFTLVGTVAALALTSGLAAACFAKVFGVAFLGKARRPGQKRERETLGPAAASLGLLATACFVLGILPSLAFVPLGRVAGAMVAAPLVLPNAPLLPVLLVTLPIVGASLSWLLSRRRGIRATRTWTCGSPVTPLAQYSATAFSKPIRTIFAFFLVPERRRIVELGGSPWFPQRIIYTTRSRYIIDEVARGFTALTLGIARRSRRLQSGSLRVYLLYAVAALIATMVFVR